MSSCSEVRGGRGKGAVHHTPEFYDRIEIAPNVTGKRGNFSGSLLASFWKLVAEGEGGPGQEGSRGSAAGETSVARAGLWVVVVA